MTTAQNKRYWAEFNAAQKIDPDLDRAAIHTQICGQNKSSKHLTNAELDKVLAAFRAITKPDNLNAQLRQLQQPETRLRDTIARQQMCLSLLLLHPQSYFLTILKTRFQTTTLDDLNPQDLVHLRNTLAARLSALRKKGILGDGKPLTEHQMCQLAHIPCFRKECAQCRTPGGAHAPRVSLPAPSRATQPVGMSSTSSPTNPEPASTAGRELAEANPF